MYILWFLVILSSVHTTSWLFSSCSRFVTFVSLFAIHSLAHMPTPPPALPFLSVDLHFPNPCSLGGFCFVSAMATMSISRASVVVGYLLCLLCHRHLSTGFLICFSFSCAFFFCAFVCHCSVAFPWLCLFHYLCFLFLFSLLIYLCCDLVVGCYYLCLDSGHPM